VDTPELHTIAPVTAEQLHAARLEVDRHSGPYKDALKARRELVQRAVRDGMRPAHAAKHAGITRAAVGKLR
jgi:hypothetical protein